MYEYHNKLTKEKNNFFDTAYSCEVKAVNVGILLVPTVLIFLEGYRASCASVKLVEMYNGNKMQENWNYSTTQQRQLGVSQPALFNFSSGGNREVSQLNRVF